MAQRRITNYGDDFTHEEFTTLVKTLLPPGRYSGLDFVLKATDRFALSAGAVLLPNGVLVLEDSEVVFPPMVPLPPGAVTYEVRVRQLDENVIGGNPAEYEVVPTGTPIDTTFSTYVLGYLQYPGSPVALAASMYVPSPLQGAQASAMGAVQTQPIQNVPPYTNFLDLGSPNVTVTDTMTGLLFTKRLTGSALIPPVPGETRVFAFQWLARGIRPTQIRVRANFPSNDDLKFELRDTSGNLVSLSSSTFPGTGVLSTYVANVLRDGTVFAEGQPFTLYIAGVLKPSTVMDLLSFTISYLPVVP